MIPNFYSVSQAQEKEKPPVYKVPAAYSFDRKVVYEMQDERQKGPKDMVYYFTRSGDYMGMVPPAENEQEKTEMLVNTKDGMMVTFTDKSASGNDSKNQKEITVMDMRHMFAGMGKGMEAIAKSLPSKEKTDAAKEKTVNKNNELDNFKKTGRTKKVFGYTAEEYTREVNQTDGHGKMRSGTMTAWYARVDFDPSMMFSMGMGNLSGDQAHSKMQQTHPDNLLGMGLTEKNYLLVESSFQEKGGKSASGMKVIAIDKTNYSKGTQGYKVKNYSGMNMREMMQQESGGSEN